MRSAIAAKISAIIPSPKPPKANMGVVVSTAWAVSVISVLSAAVCWASPVHFAFTCHVPALSSLIVSMKAPVVFDGTVFVVIVPFGMVYVKVMFAACPGVNAPFIVMFSPKLTVNCEAVIDSVLCIFITVNGAGALSAAL